MVCIGAEQGTVITVIAWVVGLIIGAILGYTSKKCEKVVGE